MFIDIVSSQHINIPPLTSPTDKLPFIVKANVHDSAETNRKEEEAYRIPIRTRIGEREKEIGNMYRRPPQQALAVRVHIADAGRGKRSR